MRKPQLSLLAISVSVASMLLASTTAFAGHTGHHNYKENYKGEAMPCPVELVLRDGLYVGLAGGYDSYRISQEIADEATLDFADGTTFSLDPVVNATGGVGGGFIGYGKYFDAFYNAYLGLEIFGNWSGAHSSYNLVVNPSDTVLDQYHNSISVENNYGISFLPGIKLSNATLFYVRLGYNWSEIKVKERLNSTTAGVLTGVESSETNTQGGFNYGLGIEAAFYDNWSLRAEYTHTDYNSFDTTLEGQFDSKFNPSDNQFMLGVIYHINM